MLEKHIESNTCERVLHELGVTSAKLTTPGRRGIPDRIFWLPGGKPLLIEFKRPGEQPRPLQSHIHALLKQLGYHVEVHDNEAEAFESVRRALDATQVSAHSGPVPS